MNIGGTYLYVIVCNYSKLAYNQLIFILSNMKISSYLCEQTMTRYFKDDIINYASV